MTGPLGCAELQLMGFYSVQQLVLLPDLAFRSLQRWYRLLVEEGVTCFTSRVSNPSAPLSQPLRKHRSPLLFPSHQVQINVRT